MSKITAKRRNALPSTEFALPKERKYLIDTRARASNAKARADEMLEEGKLSREEYEAVVRKANRKLGK